MKKNEKRGIAVLGILVLAYFLIALLVPFHKNIIFWTAFLFGLIAILAQGYVIKISFQNGNSTKSKFYGFPIARVGVIYLIAQLIVSFVCMALSMHVPLWLTVLLSMLLLAAGAIGLIAADAVRDNVIQQDETLKKDVATMQRLISQAGSLVELCQTDEMRQAVQKTANSFRYSDPVSAPELEEIEHELSVQLGELQRAVVDGDSDSTRLLCHQVEGTLTERNRLCKLGKKNRQ